MRLRSLLLALILVVLPRPAMADDHKADGYGGGSGSRGSWLWGGEFAFSYNLPSYAKLGFVVDLSIHHGKHEGETITRTTNLYGVQWAIPENNENHTIALQGLIGPVFTGTSDGTVFGGAVGALWDYLPNPDPEGGGWGVRVHADYVFANGSDGFARFSGGVVYKFGG